VRGWLGGTYVSKDAEAVSTQQPQWVLNLPSEDHNKEKSPMICKRIYQTMALKKTPKLSI
jgi:hypothetical protein